MQQKIMEPYIAKEHNLIELGVGSGFCSGYLKTKGFNIETIDIDKDKKPDILCDIIDWKPDKIYDGFLCYQVFEHMPFQNFEKIIERVSKLGIKYLYISVPHNSISKKKMIQGHVTLAKIGPKNIYLTWPLNKPVPITHKTHIWELEDGTISFEMYYDVFKKNGYENIVAERIYYAYYNVFKLR